MSLNSYLEKRVCLLLTDGRIIIGTLISCDQVTNVVLKDSVERFIREPGDDAPSIEEERGIYMARGDSVALCGLVDEELDRSITWADVRGNLIGGTKHV